MLTRPPSFALLVVFLVACGVLFLAIACAGVDRHPCDWQPDQVQEEDPHAHDAVPGDCDSAAWGGASPASSATNGGPS